MWCEAVPLCLKLTLRIDSGVGVSEADVSEVSIQK